MAKEKIQVSIYNGIFEDREPKKKVRSELVVGSIGRLHRRKCYANLIEGRSHTL